MEQFIMESEEHVDDRPPPGEKWPQYLAALTVALGGMSAGAVMGWTSPALPHLQERHNVSNVTVQDISDNEASWIGSLAPLGALFGAVPAGYFAEVIGRKSVLLLLSVPSVLGWLFIIFSQKHAASIFAGRFISGLAIGGTTVVTPLYCEEIAEDRIRGALGVYMDLMLTVGILWAYVIGVFDQYLWLSVSSCALPIIFAASFAMMPESPVYLLSKGNVSKARESLYWLRGGPNNDVQPELTRMKKLLEESVITRSNSGNYTNCKTKFMSLVCSTHVSKSLRIVFGLMFFQQMSGINAVVFYTVEIFQKAGGSWSPQTATIVVGIVQVIATFFSSLVVEVVGRRVLLMLSISCMAACLGGLSIHSIVETGQSTEEYGYEGFVPVLLFALYIVMFSIGFGPLPWFMMAELVPPEAKGWASSMSVCFNWTLVFLVTNLFPHFIRDLGPAMTYAVLGIVCLIGTLFVYALVPETKGKTRDEIQNYLQM